MSFSFTAGVPYPAVFDLPTSWSETEFVLSWHVNSSIFAPPIIDYRLEFRQSSIPPRGNWIEVNIPAQETYDLINHRTPKDRTFEIASSDDDWGGDSSQRISGQHGARHRLHLGRGLHHAELKEFQQSYALKGLDLATNYEVRFKLYTILSIVKYATTG